MERELELAGPDGGRVEHVIDDPRHLLGAGLDDRGELPLLTRLRARGEKARRAHDRVELVAQLVPDVSEQLGVDLDRAVMTVRLAVGRRRRSYVLELAHQ